MTREFNVLVTGFGVRSQTNTLTQLAYLLEQANLNAPYGNSISNPASLIARMLPTSLSTDHHLNNSGRRVNILDPIAGKFDAIPAELGTIRQRIRELHDNHGSNVDLWIHLGRGPWNFVTCERLAFRQDFTSSWLDHEARAAYYLGRDNVGQNAHDLGHNPWTELPMGLDTEIDVSAVVTDANEALKRHHKAMGSDEPLLEVRSHLEAGAAGCGFCYYESMANCFAKGRKRDVLFMHVPRHTDQDNLERARDAVLAVVGASVRALIRRETTSTVDWKEHFGHYQ